LISVIGLFVALQLVLSPTVKPAQPAVAAASTQASAVPPAERPAESSMLRASGYALTKDKLD
jgi:hypothetical protein